MDNIHKSFPILQKGIEEARGIGVLGAVSYGIADAGTLEQIQWLVVTGVVGIEGIVKIIVHNAGSPDRVGPHVPDGLKPAKVVLLPRVIGSGIVPRKAGGYVHASQNQRNVILPVSGLELRPLRPKWNIHRGAFPKAQIKAAVKNGPISPNPNGQQQNSRRYKSLHSLPS